MQPRTIVRAAIAAGLVAGAVDIGAAMLINQRGPAIILQSIASGVLGLSAYAGGGATVMLGLVLHLAMAIIIAGIFAAASVRIKWLGARPVTAGLAYGVGVFVVMNMIVVPLSAFAPRPAHLSLASIAANLAAMLVFGVIVAMLVRRLSRPS